MHIPSISLFASALLPLCLATPAPSIPNCPPHAVSSAEQQHIFASFTNAFYTQKDLQGALDTYVSPGYIQHNTAVLSGTNATLAFLGPVFSSLNFTILHSVFADGIGMVHYKVVGFNSRPTAIVDVYRMEGSCVVEHWDVIQELPLNATNPLALF